MKILKKTLIILIIFSMILGCSKKGCTNPDATNYDANAKVDDNSCQINTDFLGFSLLDKIVGIWDGPVISPTPLGSFPLWIVDFRPISASQVSAKNELNENNDIFMSFFVCKHDGISKMAFRNGGKFAGNVRNSYMIIDSVFENNTISYYRFVDPISGGNRVYTELIFQGNNLEMHTFTNKYNTLNTPVTHMKWNAVLKDKTSAQEAIDKFDFPKKEFVKDFTSTFDGLSEAVFYSTAQDPYPESEQPYLGISNVTVNILNPSTIDPSKRIMISITSQPLFDGFLFKAENLKFRSRYVFVDANNPSFNFNYMHPGKYYINAIYDTNGDNNFSSGDYMNSSFDVPFTLVDKGTKNVMVIIDFQIP